MRIFSYRNKRRVRLGIIIGIAVLAVLLLFALCRFIYLRRFLVYGDTVTLDYEQMLDPTGQKEQPDLVPNFELEITEDDALLASSQSDGPLMPMSGYYVTTSMLRELPKVLDALDKLEQSPQTLLFEMKSIYGNFYYDSDISGSYTANADIDGIEMLIARYAMQKDVYLVARIPAFTDNNFALDNQSSGLPLRSGALWMDDDNCYWLDPMSEEVQAFLVTMATELAEMGFDEVVFDGFRMPDSKNIVYDAGEWTREEAVAEAAKNLRSALNDLPIRVSFGSESPLVAVHTDRVYLTTEDGSKVADMVAEVISCVEYPDAQIVFQTASRDTRFDGYGILRPLLEGISEE